MVVKKESAAVLNSALPAWTSIIILENFDLHYCMHYDFVHMHG